MGVTKYYVVSKQPQLRCTMCGDNPPPLPTRLSSRSQYRRTIQQGCASAGGTTASASTRKATRYAPTAQWSDTRRGSDLSSQGTTQFRSYQNQNQKDHIPPNTPSYRSSAEPSNHQARLWKGPQGEQVQRFSEHVCRVSGAQFLTRIGYSLEAVQLIGRWGSDAIRRYIQDSPLARPQQPTDHKNDAHIRKIVQGQMTRSQNQFWIVHSTSGITHIPAMAETCADNRRWHTVCGWHYVTSTFQKTYTQPKQNRCLKCFRYTDNHETPELDLSGSDQPVWVVRLLYHAGVFWTAGAIWAAGVIWHVSWPGIWAAGVTWHFFFPIL